jgi:hypothetical protein
MYYNRLFISILYLFLALPGALAEEVTVTGTVQTAPGHP